MRRAFALFLLLAACTPREPPAEVAHVAPVSPEGGLIAEPAITTLPRTCPARVDRSRKGIVVASFLEALDKLLALPDAEGRRAHVPKMPASEDEAQALLCGRACDDRALLRIGSIRAFFHIGARLPDGRIFVLPHVGGTEERACGTKDADTFSLVTEGAFVHVTVKHHFADSRIVCFDLPYEADVRECLPSDAMRPNVGQREICVANGDVREEIYLDVGTRDAVGIMIGKEIHAGGRADELRTEAVPGGVRASGLGCGSVLRLGS